MSPSPASRSAIIDARDFLQSQNLGPSDAARGDLDSGQVDPRLVAVVGRLVEHHRIFVTTIKTGHAMGPRSPAGRENDHYFYRAADITEIDGASVEANPVSMSMLAVGRILMNLRGRLRPVRVMGPAEWLAALGEGDLTGFRNDAVATTIHRDHLHIGF